MPETSSDLIALLGSRICHDLISPISAIGNGVELLLMSGTVPGPELTLISESVANASARIRFFRLAFGAAAAGQRVGQAEILSILDDMTRGGRLNLSWEVIGDVDRPMVKLAFLALQCLETALPYGGRARITAEEGRWCVEATATGTKVDPVLWAQLGGDVADEDIAPAHVQFLLFPRELTRHGRKCDTSLGETTITLRF